MNLSLNSKRFAGKASFARSSLFSSRKVKALGFLGSTSETLESLRQSNRSLGLERLSLKVLKSKIKKEQLRLVPEKNNSKEFLNGLSLNIIVTVGKTVLTPFSPRQTSCLPHTTGGILNERA